MRQSISIATAANLLDTSRDTIRNMLNKGELTGHFLRREKRVYVDSITAYQQAREIEPAAARLSGACRKIRGRPTEAALTLAKFGL